MPDIGYFGRVYEITLLLDIGFIASVGTPLWLLSPTSTPLLCMYVQFSPNRLQLPHIVPGFCQGSSRKSVHNCERRGLGRESLALIVDAYVTAIR